MVKNRSDKARGKIRRDSGKTTRGDARRATALRITKLLDLNLAVAEEKPRSHAQALYSTAQAWKLLGRLTGLLAVSAAALFSRTAVWCSIFVFCFCFVEAYNLRGGWYLYNIYIFIYLYIYRLLEIMYRWP